MLRVLVLCLTLSTAGCLSAGVVNAPSTREAGAPVPFTFDGAIERLVCVRTPGPGTCHVAEGSRDFDTPGGRVARIDATFTWEATGVADATLRAYLLAVDASGEWSWEESPDTFAEGASPLSVSWVPPTLDFEVHHWSLHMASSHRAGAEGASAVAGTGVEWHVEGSYVPLE